MERGRAHHNPRRDGLTHGLVALLRLETSANLPSVLAACVSFEHARDGDLVNLAFSYAGLARLGLDPALLSAARGEGERFVGRMASICSAL